MYRVFQGTLALQTPGRGFQALNGRTQELLDESGIVTGTCHLFLQHTSASLLLCENASPEVRQDLETLISRIAPDGDPAYLHADEGEDDMAAHFRTVVAGCELTLPVSEGRLDLGTWQGLFLWEHRAWPHGRRIRVTVQGEARD